MERRLLRWEIGWAYPEKTTIWPQYFSSGFGNNGVSDE